MQTNGVFKLIEIKRTGETAGKSKTKYIHVLAVDFFNQKKEGEEGKADFFIIKAFGATADFIERNMSGSRRAYISGDLEIGHYTDKMSVEKKLTFAGQSGKAKFEVDVEKTSISIIARDVRFLDKPNETATVFVPDESGNGDEVIFEVDEPGTESTPASSNGETAGSYTVEVEGKPEGRDRKSSLTGRK